MKRLRERIKTWRERRLEREIELHVARGGHYLYSFPAPPPKVYDGPIEDFLD